ncbi:MAG: hypothetical protein GY856_31420 [bacterium]|nr:hypothetical protein [bacterium]
MPEKTVNGRPAIAQMSDFRAEDRRKRLVARQKCRQVRQKRVNPAALAANAYAINDL